MPKREDIQKVMIIGSGPIIIGQACEFDYSGTQACKALRSLGYEILLVNSNPATIMTDPGTADVTYIEPPSGWLSCRSYSRSMPRYWQPPSHPTMPLGKRDWSWRNPAFSAEVCGPIRR